MERWLKEFEAVMRDTVLDQISKAIKAYTQEPRIEWVLNWPGQIVLAVNQIFWTQAVAQALAGGRGGKEAPERALQDLLVRQNADLQNVVAKVRGPLSRNARITLGALLIMDVHNRNVVQQLIQDKAPDPFCFEWSSQLRYDWEVGSPATHAHAPAPRLGGLGTFGEISLRKKVCEKLFSSP